MSGLVNRERENPLNWSVNITSSQYGMHANTNLPAKKENDIQQ